MVQIEYQNNATIESVPLTHSEEPVRKQLQQNDIYCELMRCSKEELKNIITYLKQIEHL